MLILGIESSCDETAAAVCREGSILSNVIAAQLDHAVYGGVVPELASRLHQQQIVPVVQQALADAGVTQSELDAIAFTRGPGLLGALLVGTCFAKTYALGLGIPLIDVHHMDAHVLANFFSPSPPAFPFLCLTVSGGHTQLVLVKSHTEMEILGQTIDDAAGEAFDKAAKLLGLPYPGGPQVDTWAASGNADAFTFPTPDVGEFSFSFSGLKTSLLYLVQKAQKQDPDFLQQNLADICASYQGHVVKILLDKLAHAARKTGVKHLALAGGVSANSELRRRFAAMCEQEGWQAHIPDFVYCTDNAAMIALAGYYKAQAQDFAALDVAPFTRGKG